MSVVKKNLKMPLFLTMIGLFLLFYVNIGNIVWLNNLSDLILVDFSATKLLSVLFAIFKIIILLLVTLFCFKKLEGISDLIVDYKDEIYGLQKFIRIRYYYTYKTLLYLFYGLGCLGVILSLIANPIFMFKHSHNLIITILITIVIIIPINSFIGIMLNKYFKFVKSILSVYR